MAKCNKCGAELFETSRFCPECGAPVEDPIAAAANAADPEAAALILEAAAEKALADIPDIKRIDTSPAVGQENAEEEQTPLEDKAAHLPDENSADAESDEASSESPSQDAAKADEEAADKLNENAAAENSGAKRSSKAGLIAVIVLICAAAAGAGIYFMNNNGAADTAARPEQTAAIGMSADISDTAAVQTEGTYSSDSKADTAYTDNVEETEPALGLSIALPEQTSAEDTAKTTETEQPTLSESTSEEVPTVALLTEDMTIEPEHSEAIGRDISARISLSAAGAPAEALTDSALITAEYTTSAEMINGAPVVMIMVIDGEQIELAPSGSYDSAAAFEFSLMRAAAEEAGFALSDIDELAFRSNGAPVDVHTVTVIPGDMTD